MLLPACTQHHSSRHLPRRLLTAALALGWAPVAGAQLLWEDAFNGPELDPVWEITTQNVASWSAGFSVGAWHLQTILGQRATPGRMSSWAGNWHARTSC